METLLVIVLLYVLLSVSNKVNAPSHSAKPKHGDKKDDKHGAKKH
ncbi:MAG TPA: hypothetical protein VEA59_04420 [Patescibacteria group bacterium]|nr:hypothetical protein [Patescibacteria group bacterium]